MDYFWLAMTSHKPISPTRLLINVYYVT